MNEESTSQRNRTGLEDSSRDTSRGLDIIAGGIIAVLAGIISSYIILQLETQQSHQHTVQSINVINCINRFLIAPTLADIHESPNADWNVRYLTDYYQSNWTDILEQSGTSTLRYVELVVSMENANTALRRIDSQNPQGDIRTTILKELSSGANGVIGIFNQLNVTENTCNRMLQVNPKT